MGIGEAIAESIADAGSYLILFSRSENKLEELAKRLNARNSKCSVIFRPVDIQNFEAVDAARATIDMALCPSSGRPALDFLL